MKWFFGLLLLALCSLTMAGTKKENDCTEPPEVYGKQPLAECAYDEKAGSIGCFYNVCMHDPTGQGWCGEIILVRDSCEGAWKPYIMQLVPVPTDKEAEKQKDLEKSL